MTPTPFLRLQGLTRGSSMLWPSTSDLAFRRSQQTGQHLDGGRFAGAVGPEEAVEGAALDAQIDAVDRTEIVEETG